MDNEGVNMDDEGATSDDEDATTDDECANGVEGGDIMDDDVSEGGLFNPDTSVLFNAESFYSVIPVQDIDMGHLENDMYSYLEQEIRDLEEIVGGKKLRVLKEQICKIRLFIINLRRELVESNSRHYHEATERVFHGMRDNFASPFNSRGILRYPGVPVGCWKVYLHPRDRGELRPCPGCHQLGVLENECSGCLLTRGRCGTCGEIGPIGVPVACRVYEIAGCTGSYDEPLKYGGRNHFDYGRFVLDRDDDVEEDEAEGAR